MYVTEKIFICLGYNGSVLALSELTVLFNSTLQKCAKYSLINLLKCLKILVAKFYILNVKSNKRKLSWTCFGYSRVSIVIPKFSLISDTALSLFLVEKISWKRIKLIAAIHSTAKSPGSVGISVKLKQFTFKSQISMEDTIAKTLTCACTKHNQD